MTSLKEKIESKIKIYKSVGFYDTAENNSVWSTFVQFCKLEADGNYLMGLKILLTSYSTDWKYQSLYDEIQTLKEKMLQSQSRVEKVSKDRSIKTFGMEE